METASVDERICKLCRYARRIFLAAWVLDAIFMAVSVSLGGTAQLGKVVRDQHYLGDHGRYVPVSKMVFDVMEVWGMIALLLFILGFVAIVIHNGLPQCKAVPKRWGFW